MNIKEFKEGDIITRVEPVDYKHNDIKDGSWCGDRMIFIGCDKKIIFVIHPIHNDEPLTIEYAKNDWDEGWDYYPETLWQKAKKMLSSK